MSGAAVMKICANCGFPLAPRRPHHRYCSDSCRSAAWKRNHPNGLDRRGERVLAARTRSGPQVSYRRAVSVLAERLVALGVVLTDDPEGRRRVAWALAEDTLKRALSERQRARIGGHA